MVKDLTHGSPVRLIVLFALPLLLGNLFQQVYNMVDALVVGRMIGVGALAAVGASMPLIFFIIGFVIGLSSGFSIILAQRFGAKDWDGLRRGFCASVILGALASLLFTALSLPHARDLLHIMSTPPDIIDDAETYLSISLCGLAPALFSNIFSSTIMALGDSRTPLIFLGISCVLNSTLDLVFISVFGMGVGGAALATVIAQIFSALLCLGYILKALPMVRPHLSDWRHVTLSIISRHMRMGIPMAFQSSLISLGIMFVQAALNTLGTDAVAGFTAAVRVDTIGLMPLMSFGLAMATYTGQNYGAGRLGRIRLGVRQGSLVSLGYAAVAAAVCILAGEPLVRIFIGEGQEHIVALGYKFLVIQCIMYWVLALLFIIRNTLQGLGKSLVPTIAGIGELAARAIAAFVLVKYFGFLGICLASPLAWIGSLLPLLIAYTRWVRSARVYSRR